MIRKLSALLVEDSEVDAELIVQELKDGGFDSHYERVETRDALTAALDRRLWDVVICDYSMPQFSGAAALTLFQERGLDIPFIIVSGTLGEEAAVAMMKAGAHDYVMKGNLARLVPAVRREMKAAEMRRVSRQTQASTSLLAAIVESSDDAIFSKTLEGIILSWNEGAQRMYGHTEQEMIGRRVAVLMPPDRLPEMAAILDRIRRGERVVRYETVRVRKDGTPIPVSVTVSPVKDAGGRIVGASSIARDVTGRKREEAGRLQLIGELTNALQRVRTLSGLPPIRPCCKKIRDDHGYWQSVEVYVREHSDVEFSHSICPDCMVREFPGVVRTN